MKPLEHPITTVQVEEVSELKKNDSLKNQPPNDDNLRYKPELTR